MTQPTSPPPEVPPATDADIEMPEVVFNGGGDDPLLEYMAEAPAPGLSSVAPAVATHPVTRPPWSGEERRAAVPVATPVRRAASLERGRRAQARFTAKNDPRNSAVHRAGRYVWLIPALGGAAVGALGMWLAGVQPARVARSGQSTAVAIETAVIPKTTPAFDAIVSGAAVPDQARAPLSGTDDAGSVPELASGVNIAASVPEPRSGAEVSAGVPSPPSVPAGVPDVESAAAPTETALQGRVPSQLRSTGYRGSVAFRSQPLGAQVSINGQPVGVTPLNLPRLSVGSRAVRIEATGYQSWSGAVQVVANRQTRVNVKLGRLP